jgi:hypothetical protein
MTAYGQDVGVWPPNPSPVESVGYALTSVGGVLTNPCFFGGCRYDSRDACYPGRSCSGSWGGVTAADERSTTRAYRALSNLASKMAAEGASVPITIDVESEPSGPRHVRRARHKAPE